MKLTVNILKEVAKELNEVVDPDPPIKITSRSSIDSLSDEIIAAGELLEKGDTISKQAFDVLTELEADVDAAVKVKGGDKKTAAKPKTEKKAEAKPKATGPKLKDVLEELLKEKKYTPEQIKEKLFKKFPDKKPSTITTIMSDCKSEKWTPFSKPAKIGKDGIMRL